MHTHVAFVTICLFMFITSGAVVEETSAKEAQSGIWFYFHFSHT